MMTHISRCFRQTDRMSTAASTVPGRRDVYRSTTTRLGLPKYASATRRNSHADTGHEEIRKNQFQKDYGKGDGYSYMFTGAEEEKPWIRKEEEQVNDAASMKNKATLGPRRRQMDNITRIHKEEKLKKEEYNRFMNVKKKKLSMTEVNGNKVAVITTTKKYDEMMEEHVQLYAAHNSYKKQIKKLESENDQMLQNFNSLYEENKRLREKMDCGGQPVVESYTRVYDDRRILREAEDKYKVRITHLEHDMQEQVKLIEKLNDELEKSKVKPIDVQDQLNARAKAAQLNTEIRKLKTDNNNLKKWITKNFEGKLDEKDLPPLLQKAEIRERQRPHSDRTAILRRHQAAKAKLKPIISPARSVDNIKPSDKKTTVKFKPEPQKIIPKPKLVPPIKNDNQLYAKPYSVNYRNTQSKAAFKHSEKKDYQNMIDTRFEYEKLLPDYDSYEYQTDYEDYTSYP